jgi:hypothetical protein
MTLLDRIRALLLTDGVPSQDGREEICFLTKCQNLSVSMRIRLGPELVLVFAQLPIFAPIYRRAALCEAIVRANYGLYIGNFEMDLGDGELRFKSSLPVNDAEPSDSQIRRLIANSIGVVSHYGPALLDVACTELEPDTAISKADANWEELHRNHNIARA